MKFIWFLFKGNKIVINGLKARILLTKIINKTFLLENILFSVDSRPDRIYPLYPYGFGLHYAQISVSISSQKISVVKI